MTYLLDPVTGISERIVPAKQAMLMASIGLAVGACLTLAACRAYYSAPLQCISVKDIDGMIAKQMQDADGDQLLQDPLHP